MNAKNKSTIRSKLTGFQVVEWPTLFVAVVSYVGVVGTVLFANVISVPIAVAILALALALQSSLQHEVLHGHPFHSRKLSDLLAFPAVGLFIPFERFRDTHLAHHFDPKLTDPYDDPESYYLDPGVWQELPRVVRWGLWFNNTLLGRVTIGPLIGTLLFYAGDVAKIASGDKVVMRAYVLHLIGMMPVLWFVTAFGTLPMLFYVLSAYLALSILKIRTYLEHRAHETVPGRTVIIEDRGLLSFLFLNNNLHAVHHAHPGLAWFQLPAFYRAHRSEFLEENRSYLYGSYGEIFKKHLLNAKEPVSHPLMLAKPQTRDAKITKTVSEQVN